MDRFPDTLLNARRFIKNNQHLAVKALKVYGLIGRETQRVVVFGNAQFLLIEDATNGNLGAAIGRVNFTPEQPAYLLVGRSGRDSDAAHGDPPDDKAPGQPGFRGAVTGFHGDLGVRLGDGVADIFGRGPQVRVEVTA